jgi:hypothetical protein
MQLLRNYPNRLASTLWPAVYASMITTAAVTVSDGDGAFFTIALTCHGNQLSARSKKGIGAEEREWSGQSGWGMSGSGRFQHFTLSNTYSHWLQNWRDRQMSKKSKRNVSDCFNTLHA